MANKIIFPIKSNVISFTYHITATELSVGSNKFDFSSTNLTSLTKFS